MKKKKIYQNQSSSLLLLLPFFPQARRRRPDLSECEIAKSKSKFPESNSNMITRRINPIYRKITREKNFISFYTIKEQSKKQTAKQEEKKRKKKESASLSVSL